MLEWLDIIPRCLFQTLIPSLSVCIESGVARPGVRPPSSLQTPASDDDHTSSINTHCQMSHKSYRTRKFHCLVNCRSQLEFIHFRKAVSDCVAELHYLIIRNRIKHYFSKLSSLNEAES